MSKTEATLRMGGYYNTDMATLRRSFTEATPRKGGYYNQVAIETAIGDH